jgi:hypothetical protein
MVCIAASVRQRQAIAGPAYYALPSAKTTFFARAGLIFQGHMAIAARLRLSHPPGLGTAFSRDF